MARIFGNSSPNDDIKIVDRSQLDSINEELENEKKASIVSRAEINIANTLQDNQLQQHLLN